MSVSTDHDEFSPLVFRFGAFELRLPSRELLRGGAPVELQPKVFDFIAYLLLNRGRVVEKDELLDAVWPKQVVTEAALTRCAMKARRALDDEAENPQVILTVHGRGYRFLATVTPVGERRAVPRELPATAAAEAPDTPEADAAVPVGESTPAPVAAGRAAAPARRFPRAWRLGWGAIALLAIALGWWQWRQAAGDLPLAGPARVAILPFENATGEPRHDWARLGLMASLGDILRQQGAIRVIGAREVLDIEAAVPADERLARLRAAHAVTHLVEGRIETHLGQLRLNYALVDAAGGRRERTVVAPDVPGLAHAAGADLRTVLGVGAAPREISHDSFANEAYLRGRAQRLQGDVEGAMEYFRLASEQAPAAFWPRYEYALGLRDLGRLDEASKALEQLRAEADEGDDALARIGARNSLAILRWREGDLAAAADQLEAALALGEALGEPERSAVVLTNLGILARHRGDLAASRDYLGRAIEAEADAGIERTSGSIHNSLAQLDLAEGNLDAADTHLQAALAQFQLVGDRRDEAIALNGLAQLRRRQGRFEEARDLAAHALEVHRSLGNRVSEASALIGLSMAEAQLGQLRRAVEHAQSALTLAESIGNRPNATTALSLLGQYQRDLGAYAESRRWSERAHERRLEDGDLEGARRERLQLARLARAEGDAGASERQALTLRQELLADDAPAPLRVDLLRHLLRLRLDAADAAGAQRWWEQAMAAAEPLEDDRLQARLALDRAEIALARGELDAAAAAVAEAAARIGDEPELLRVQAALAAERGDALAALDHEQAAKAAAGERWTGDDEARLQRRRAAARR